MADTTKGGLLRDADGVIVVVRAQDAAEPVTWRSGNYVDADGALVIAEKGV